VTFGSQWEFWERRFPEVDFWPASLRICPGDVTSGSRLSSDKYSHQPQHHRVSFAVQFSTMDIGVVPVFNCVLTRNLCPSLLTS
jgi:hypothetical protein